MELHLQLKFRTVYAAFGAQFVDSMPSVTAHPGTNFLLGHGPPTQKQPRTAFADKKAIHDLELELCLVLFHRPQKFIQLLGGQFKPRGDSVKRLAFDAPSL